MRLPQMSNRRPLRMAGEPRGRASEMELTDSEDGRPCGGRPSVKPPALTERPARTAHSARLSPRRQLVRQLGPLAFHDWQVRASRPPLLRMRSSSRDSLLAPRFVWPRPLSVGTYPHATTSRANTWKDDPVPQMHRTTRKPPRWSVGHDPAPHSWAAMASPDPSVGGGPTAKSGAPGPSSSHAGQGAPTHPTATTENRND